MKKLLTCLTVSTLLLSSCSWKPEKEVVVPERLEFFDKFIAIPLVGACEFGLYGLLIWIIDKFFIN